jgi:hypothetical protein
MKLRVRQTYVTYLTKYSVFVLQRTKYYMKLYGIEELYSQNIINVRGFKSGERDDHSRFFFPRLYSSTYSSIKKRQRPENTDKALGHSVKFFCQQDLRSLSAQVCYLTLHNFVVNS